MNTLTIEIGRWLQRLGSGHRRADRGASLVEYALLAALIALVCVVAVTYFGDSTSGSLSSAGSHVTSANAKA